VPMYFLSKAITESGIKVVLSGEGADEILEVICI
jgi:asparagine synthase (glutamine-hydrolysing)